MVSTTARYIYTVHRLKSVSLAAEELYISQPALSRMIKKAETQLGAPIFNRKTLPFSLTPEGKVYIDAVEKMLHLEKEAKEKLDDIQHAHSGTLRIATTTHLSYYVIPKVLKEFQKNYPQVDIHIIMTDTDKLLDHLKKGTVELVFISGTQIPGEYAYAELLKEKFVVAMPRKMVTQALLPYSVSYEALVDRTYRPEKEITDMNIFQGIEFIYSPINSDIQKKRKIFFGGGDISPYITSNTGRQQFNYNLMCTGFGALFTTDANIATMPNDPECMYFVIGGSGANQSFSVIYPDEDTLPVHRITKEFIRTATTLFSHTTSLKELISK